MTSFLVYDNLMTLNLNTKEESYMHLNKKFLHFDNNN